MKFFSESINMGTGSNSDLLRLSYTVLPPAKEISRSREGPPKSIPIFIPCKGKRFGKGKLHVRNQHFIDWHSRSPLCHTPASCLLPQKFWASIRKYFLHSS